MKKEGRFYSLHIADIHFGAVNDKDLINELNSHFIKYINEHGKAIDMIVIHGDYFNSKIFLTSSTSRNAIMFIQTLLQLCKKYSIELRLIKGTKTHDFNQLNNFKTFESLYPFFRIINTVEEENYERQLKILYVPEEYINDQDEYYKEFMNKKYDVMWGHGTWDVFSFESQKQDSERNIKGYPVLKYSDWQDVIKYHIIFGHIHTHSNYKKLTYVGSYSRWIYSEEKEKGFIASIIDFKKEKNQLKFIPNTSAKEYITIKLDDKNKSINEIVKDINKLKEDSKHYRIQINKESMDLENFKILKESLSNTDEIKLEYKNGLNSEISKAETYSFLGSDVNENIKNFIKEKNNVELTIEEIQKLTTTEDIDDNINH